MALIQRVLQHQLNLIQARLCCPRYRLPFLLFQTQIDYDPQGLEVWKVFGLDSVSPDGSISMVMPGFQAYHVVVGKVPLRREHLSGTF